MAYGAGTSNPLIDSDGVSRLQPGPNCEITLGDAVAAVIASAGDGAAAAIGAVHTRTMHQRGDRRTAVIAISPATAAEVAMVADLVRYTAGGNLPTAWRFPGLPADPAGSADTAPRWRMVAHSIDRSTAALVAISLRLEEA